MQIIDERGLVFGFFSVTLQNIMAWFKRHIFLMAFLLTHFAVSAQDGVAADTLQTKVPSLDSVQVSILTCTPGADLYAKFGHTALRVQDFTLQKDVVFNYGCFNYNSDNFVWKFLLGQTDYLLDGEAFDYFMYRYRAMGNGVTEQVLNLSGEEANRLLALLLINLKPENQEYRYNWLYDNCTERARDMVEKAVDGKVVYEKAAEGTTVRQMLRACLKTSPWSSFGIDMILGEEIDHPVDKRVQMFLPAFFMGEADEAIIEGADDTKKQYVAEKHELMQATYVDEVASVFTPMVAFVLLLAIVVCISVYDWRRKKVSLWLDVTLAILQGLAGVLVAFLYFFSEHSGVDSNWLVLIFNPLPLLYAVWLVICQRRGCRNRLAVVNMAVLAAFLLTMWLCPQSFDVAMYVVVLTLLVRATIYAALTDKSKRNNNQ